MSPCNVCNVEQVCMMRSLVTCTLHSTASVLIGSCDTMYRFTYEVAPVFVLLEYVTLKKMREIIGWEDGRGDGIFSPGKTEGFNVSTYT